MSKKIGYMMASIALVILAIDIFVYLIGPDLQIVRLEILSNDLIEFILVIIYLSSAIYLDQVKDSLQKLYLDKVGLLLFVFSGFFQYLFLKPVYYIIVVISLLWIFKTTISRWALLKTISLSWIGKSILHFIVILFLIVIYTQIWVRGKGSVDESNYPNIIVLFLTNVIFVAVHEEVFFRGVLYSGLINTGLSPKASFVIQFLLFWLIHYQKESSIISLYLFLPLTTIYFSYLAHKSKQITPSILIHSLYNTFVPWFYMIALTK